MTADHININPLNQLLACLTAANRNHEVEDLVKKHLNDDNEHDLRYFLGLSYASQNKVNEAIHELTSSVNNSNGNILSKKLAFKLYINKAKTMAKNNDFDGLSSILKSAVDLGLDDPEIQKEFDKFRNILPLSYLKAGQRVKAASIWEEEFKKKPLNFRVIHNLALLYYWWAIDTEENFNNKSHTKYKEKSRTNFILKNEKLSGDEKNIDFLWGKSIAYWVMLLNAEIFWREWKTEREKICSLTISEGDIRGNVIKLIDERFNKVFHDYIDKYKKNGRDKDALRHKDYLTKLILEKNTTSCYRDMINHLSELGMRVDGAVKRWELIRFIQKEEGNTPCFGTAKSRCKTSQDCCWVESCLENNSRNNENLLISQPCGPLMIGDFNVFKEVLKLAELCSKNIDDNEKLLRFIVYLSPLGKFLILIDEQNKPQQAITEMGELSKDMKDSIEYKFLYALALSQQSMEFLQGNPIAESLQELSLAKRTITDAMNCHKDHILKPLLEPVGKMVDKEVIGACKKEARKLRDNDKFDDAINILTKGLEIVDSTSLKQHIAVIYCDRGTSKLNNKKFSAARKDFEKALSYDSDNMRAKQGIGTTYNNEGVATSNEGKTIPLFEKALKYDPDSDVVKNNLAGAYNGKAVQILNNITQYSSASDCDNAINLLKKGLKLLNSSLDVSKLDSLAYAEEWDLNDIVKDWPDDLYKTMMRNIWIGCQNRKNLREY